MQIITIEVGMIGTNCYLINYEENKAFIIDPGDNSNAIQKKCSQLNLGPIAVLLTHGHFDHMMAAEAIKEAYGIPIYAGEAEKELLNNPRYNGSVMINKPCTLTADRWLAGQADIFGFTVIATPGHTAGSVCYYHEKEKILFSGDTLFKDSFGRTDLATGDMDTLAHSIKNILFALPEDVKVYPGHGPATTIGYEKRHNMINSF